MESLSEVSVRLEFCLVAEGRVCVLMMVLACQLAAPSSKVLVAQGQTKAPLLLAPGQLLVCGVCWAAEPLAPGSLPQPCAAAGPPTKLPSGWSLGGLGSSGGLLPSPVVLGLMFTSHLVPEGRK